MVVLLAVGPPVDLEEVPPGEGLPAGLLRADEAPRVPLGVEDGDVVPVGDGITASCAARGELVRKALGAEGPPPVLVVSSLSEWSAALRAQEALGVPGEVEGGHAPVQHWALAAGAPRGEETVVVGLAVRPTVALEEAG